MPQSKKPINPKVYRLLIPFVFKLVGDEGFEPSSLSALYQHFFQFKF